MTEGVDESAAVAEKDLRNMMNALLLTIDTCGCTERSESNRVWLRTRYILYRDDSFEHQVTFAGLMPEILSDGTCTRHDENSSNMVRAQGKEDLGGPSGIYSTSA